jgi:hypothetical protein
MGHEPTAYGGVKLGASSCCSSTPPQAPTSDHQNALLRSIVYTALRKMAICKE